MNIEICDDIGCADYNCQKCMRKSTTMNTKRNFILIEKEEKYCKIAKERLRQEVLL